VVAIAAHGAPQRVDDVGQAHVRMIEQKVVDPIEDHRNGAAAEDALQPAGAPRRSQRGLDWFAFFMADIQTGWGPFVAAYLTSVAWTQFDIGLILTIGTLAALALQIPAGALVDRVPAKRLLAAIAVICVSGSALLLALWPTFGVVAGAKVLHAVASCLFGPVLAAISLGLVGYRLLSERLGRNVRFLSLGNAIAAGVMGGVGYYFSNQAIFFLTAALAVPTLVALLRIRPGDIDPDLARGGIRSLRAAYPHRRSAPCCTTVRC
jgi:MFS family permease